MKTFGLLYSRFGWVAGGSRRSNRDGGAAVVHWLARCVCNAENWVRIPAPHPNRKESYKYVLRLHHALHGHPSRVPGRCGGRRGGGRHPFRGALGQESSVQHFLTESCAEGIRPLRLQPKYDLLFMFHRWFCLAYLAGHLALQIAHGQPCDWGYQFQLVNANSQTSSIGWQAYATFQGNPFPVFAWTNVMPPQSVMYEVVSGHSVAGCPSSFFVAPLGQSWTWTENYRYAFGSCNGGTSCLPWGWWTNTPPPVGPVPATNHGPFLKAFAVRVAGSSNQVKIPFFYLKR